MTRISRRILANLPYLAIVAVLALIPLFISNHYYIQILIFIGIYSILALSLNLLNGYVGLLSIGHAAFYGIGAYASAKLVMEVGFPFPLAMLGSGIIAGVFGYVIAKPTLRLSGIYMTLATLGFNMIFFLVLQNWMSFTNGPLGIMDIPSPSIFGYIIESRVQYYYLIFFLVLLTIGSMHRLMTCRFGRALVGIRENELAAEAMGVHTTRYKVQAFVLAAFYAGIAGSYYAHFIKYISPDSFYIYESFILLAMLAFGGQGNLIGPVVGAAVLIIIPEVFRFLQEYRMLVYGSVLIVMMLVRRQGLLGGKNYSLRLTRFDDQQQAVYTRGDKFLPTQ
ncbi:Branched-chain amino acid ABC transporter, permease protein LivM (TC 3.A.1.4.1) [Olavius sp. associated proteobacterium Delta 1]|nr:Branched-chain amino acid ABC transporter, permease protein LivM (TC 3.A.1.4.1) [Olavius sp. associated proteobacterium Delta 1]